MKIQESAENYLEAILMVHEEKGQVRAIDIVNELNFSKPSVSVAMKQLEENGYIERDNDGHISLTSKGSKIATDIYERHSVLTKLLIRLGVSEDVARADACRMEHDMTDETFEAIKAHTKEILQEQ